MDARSHMTFLARPNFGNSQPVIISELGSLKLGFNDHGMVA